MDSKDTDIEYWDDSKELSIEIAERGGYYGTTLRTFVSLDDILDNVPTSHIEAFLEERENR